MGKRGSKPDAQFVYWDRRRKGMTQSQIAREFEISRQAVNKSIKLAERDILYRLLETAQTSGILVEWQDAKKGVLIGLSPQLGNLGCIMVIDTDNNTRLFYDQDGNRDPESRSKVYRDLDRVLGDTLGIHVRLEEKFKTILAKIVRGNESE